MRRKVFAAGLLFLALVTSLLYARGVQAALGEKVDSVESDRKALAAVRHGTTTRDGYTVHEMKSPATTLREYVSSSGIVFAIAWNGLNNPDLTPLLGSYIDEYRKAQQQTPRRPGRKFSQVKGTRVVVEKWGNMRNYRGRAYDPELIPPGVKINEIR